MSEKIVVEKNASKEAFKFKTLFGLFIVGSITGFFVEGLWAFVRVGHWENHSATIWGPFCVIYGFGAIAIYVVSTFLQDKNLLLRFGVYSLAGGIVEYVGSLFQEIVFGSESWNYQAQFLNVDGRGSLMMAMIWGILGLLFISYVYKPLSKLFTKLEDHHTTILISILAIFMTINLSLTSMAILRWKDRLNQVPPKNILEKQIDLRFDNDMMENKFHNMKFIKN